jgi:lysozyme
VTACPDTACNNNLTYKTSGNYLFTTAPSGSGFYLSFPLPSNTAYSARITSVFDHSGGWYAANQQVVAYTGEVGNVKDLKEKPAVFSGVSLYSYKKSDGSAFLAGKANYVGTSGSASLNYDGHPGYDYPVDIGTAVSAAADGLVVTANTDPNDPVGKAGMYVKLEHVADGYQTEYLHLSQVLVSLNQTVTRGQLIGYSGNTGPVSTGPHLHFEVRKKVTTAQGTWTSVDPYGWTGSGADPYVIANVNLWQVPTQGPAPIITGIVPNTPLPASTTNQTFKVIGSNIQTTGAHLIFTDPTGQIYNSSAHVSREGPITATEFTYQFNNGNTPGKWLVKVQNPDGQQSNEVTFQVVTSAPPATTTVLGLDVSHWQGTINWAQVRSSGKVFAFVKATNDDLGAYDDSMFVQNMTNGKAAGLLMGAYHAASNPLAGAVAEANHFLSIARPYIAAGYLRPVLDVEPSAADTLGQPAISNWIRDWCNTVETSTGVRPILYMTRYYAKQMAADLNKYPLWIATDLAPLTNSDPGDMGSWTSWAFQQYGSEHTLSTSPGITGYADLDSFNGDIATLNSSYVIGSAAPVPSGCVITPMAPNATVGNTAQAFTATCTSGAPTSYAWTVDSIAVTGSANIYTTVSSLGLGLHTVAFTASNANGPSTPPTSTTLTVSAAPVPSGCTITPLSPTAMVGATAKAFTAACSSGSPTNYAWTVDGIPVMGTANTYSTVANLGDGLHTVAFTANNANGASTPPTSTTLTVIVAPAPAVSFNPSSLTFPNQNIGTTGPAQVLTVTNTGTGNAVLNFGNISVSGDFALTNGCTSSLNVGASCNLGLKFTPTLAGTRVGSLSVGSNAASSPNTMALSGIGLTPIVCSLTAAPTSVRKNGSTTLTASCTPAANTYSWTGGTCAGKTTSTCTDAPGVTTNYFVTGTNNYGNNTASATVTVKAVDLTPILMLLLD